MMNKIWGVFIIIGVVYSFFTGNINVINSEILSCGEIVLNMIMKLFPIMALWLGIMKIASVSELLKKMSIILYPITRFIFPDIPKDSDVISLITSLLYPFAMSLIPGLFRIPALKIKKSSGRFLYKFSSFLENYLT